MAFGAVTFPLIAAVCAFVVILINVISKIVKILFMVYSFAINKTN